MKSASALPKIPEPFVGRQMDRYHDASVSSDWNIRDHLWGGLLISVGPIRLQFTDPFWANRSIALLFVTYVENK